MAETFPPPLVQENTAQGIPGGASNAYQVGINDVDAGAIMEQNLQIPWVRDPEQSWLEYSCWMETRLDPGIVTHFPMPQEYREWDQLGTDAPNSAGMATRQNGGPNLVSNANYTGVVQQMAVSRYRVILKGAGVRAGYQPSIPKLVSIGGQDAIPDGEQVVDGPRIIGNYGGVPVYFASWVIPYTVALPPTRNETPPTNLAERIGAVSPENLPRAIQVPFSAPDSNSVTSGPQSRIDLQTGITREAVQ
ncbi:MAG: hypothetical protein K2X38_25520 [Gemmataceae bacterium]|nr:hypothetical protein [Gemmataceae bacterium]